MHPHFEQPPSQHQTLLQLRLEELNQQFLFLQALFQSWEDLHLLLPSEERSTFFASLQQQSLLFRQAQQRFRQDLQQAQKKKTTGGQSPEPPISS